jgi:hypothetical protein
MTPLADTVPSAILGRVLDDSYLAEMLRTSASRVYAETDSNGEGAFLCHSNRIVSKVFTRLGSGTACDVSRDQLSQLFKILVKIGDLADIGKANYAPRESRVSFFVDGWGRIAGGVPLECAGVSGEGVEDHLESVFTIGRMVKLSTGVAMPVDWEICETHLWSKASDNALYEHLLENCLGVRCPPVVDSCEFYDTNRSGGRRFRWRQKKPALATFIVARIVGQADYFVILPDPKNDALEWFELLQDDARKWIVLAERITKLRNFVPSACFEGYRVVHLPNILPDFLLRALLSCSAATRRTDKGWELRIGDELLDFLVTILALGNCALS